MATELKPWYAVATPHEDIREGRLDEAVFAANLWAVVQGTAPAVYLDPEEFFSKSFMTQGLATALLRVARGLRGDADAGDRIISLQTAFGGGKTHTLVALWHLAKNGAKLKRSPAGAEFRKAIGDRFPERIRGVAVFTNATCDATQGRMTPEGVRTRTLWGEIAYQLGGKALYEMVRPNDETQRVPQGIFAEVLRAASPCVILLDELADYCVGAAAVPVGGTTLADQTISFIQQLSEAVQAVPGTVAVATLPASKYEVAHSEKGQEAFVVLEKRFQRLGADLKPVADEEIYDVVRARLFESVAPRSLGEYPRKVAEAYRAMYGSHADELPGEASKASYRDHVEQSYPFHPLLIDALYTRWGGHPDFQRTRGVLRLLASVVGDLWKRRDSTTQSQPLIQPCHVRWSIDALQAALTRLWGPAYQSVVAADVLGDRANARAFDEERGGDWTRERIGEGLAAAILLGSFGGAGERSGFSRKDLQLACARPGLNWNYLDGAILELENRCFYLHSAAAGSLGKRYWFGTKPTLNKLVVQYRQHFAQENFEEEILASLREHSPKGAEGGATWRVVVDPESDLPEQKSLTLLILSPALAWADEEGSRASTEKRILELSGKCGGKERLYRNTLLFVAAAPRGLAKLRQAWREKAALAGVRTDYAPQLDEEQRADLKKRLDAAETSVVEALGPAYTVPIRVAGRELAVVALADARANFREHLTYLWTVLVEDEEWVLRRVGSVTLEKAGLVPEKGGIRVKDAIEAFLRFTDKPMVASREAVTTGLAQACRDGLIGIARGAKLDSLVARYCGEAVPLDSNEDGVWVIPAFEIARAESAGRGTTLLPGASPTGVPGRLGPGSTRVMEPEPAGRTAEGRRARPIRRIRVSGSVPVESWGDIFRSFVGPAARMSLKRLDLGVRFEMDASPDAPVSAEDSSLMAMREAARQLGLTLEVEE